MSGRTTERDATLDLLVPARSRARRLVAVVVAVALVVTVVVGTVGWPRVGASGWSFTRDAETTPVSLGVTEIRLTGLGLPVTLHGVHAPPGWHVRSVGVVDPSSTDVVALDDTTGLRRLPARVHDGSRIVVEWEIACEDAVALAGSPGAADAILVTEDPADLPEDGEPRPILVGDQAASLDLRALGAPVLDDEGSPGDGRVRVVRTPTFDLAAACGLSEAQQDRLRGVSGPEGVD